jgi:hypothetical protein
MNTNKSTEKGTHVSNVPANKSYEKNKRKYIMWHSIPRQTTADMYIKVRCTYIHDP